MDLKVSNTNFQGKKEILYGLKKASDEVYTYSMNMQPRILRLGEKRETFKNEVVAKAYLDMVTKDSKFKSVAMEISAEELRSIKRSLRAQENGVRPLENFRNFLNDVMNKNGVNSKADKEAAQSLLDKLA